MLNSKVFKVKKSNGKKSGLEQRSLQSVDSGTHHAKKLYN